MFKYFSLLFDSNQGSTVLLYTMLFVFGSLFAFLSQSKGKFRLSWFLFSFFLLWFFFAFNDVGIDTEHYKHYFRIYTSFADCDGQNGAVELLYQYLNVILHYITKSPDIAVAIVRTLQLAIFYYAIYIMKDRIKLGFAIMAYVAFFYFDSFNLLRSSLSGSLCLLSFAKLYGKKYVSSLITAGLAFGFHFSALTYIVVLLIYMLSNSKALSKKKYLLAIFAIIVIFVIVNYGNSFIVGQIVKNDLGEGRYDNYIYGSSSVGFFILFKYLPVFAILYLIGKKVTAEDSRWWFMNFMCGIAGFAIAILAYQIGIMARAAIMFSQAYVFFIPYYVIVRRQEPYIKTATLGRAFNTIMILFYIIMFVFSLSSLYEPSGLNDFKFYWQ